jgi:transcriptional regulator with XRE-family HTH domain
VPATTSKQLAHREAFGGRVRAARHSAGLSQEALAHRAGLDRSYVGQVERGERNVTLDNIYRLASALDIEAGSLL